MPYHKMFCTRHIWRYVIAISGIFYSAGILHAQDVGEQKFYTAPRELHDWVFFGNSESSSWEYDQKTLVRTDSIHLKVRIRETPLEYCYNDVRGAKMWQWRSIQEYSDSLRFHPQFDYEGYEYYGFSVLEETINLRDHKFRVCNAADYNLGGLVLSLWQNGIDTEKPIPPGSPEDMVIEVISNTHSDKY